MQTVSQDYAESMKSPLRNRGYIQVSFGIFDQEAQADASIDEGDYLWYSNDSRVFTDGNDAVVYCTLEKDFCKVDGSMLYLPKKTSNVQPYNTGLITSDLVSDENITVEIDLSTAMTWYGLTIDFGENYPVSFDIVYGSSTLQVRNNTKSVYVAEQAFTNVSSIQIVFRGMKSQQTRGRIYNIKFGVGYSFGNDDIMDSSLSRIISPISEFLPQFDFTVTLKNYDRRFDVNNPNSPLNFLSTNYTVTAQYGYELDDGTVEWLPGQTLYCSDWESDNKTATIRACDILRTLDGQYLGGTWADLPGKTFYQLAEEVLSAAGITNYTLDNALADYDTQMPIPPMSFKEALQVIANGAGCIITLSRDGGIVIKQHPASASSGDFRMEEIDMLSYPKAIRSDPVKTLIVKAHGLDKNGSEDTILSEEITVSANEEKTYTFSEPIYDWRVEIEGVDMSSTAIVASGDYYLTVKFASGGTVDVDIYGKRYTQQEYTRTVPVSSRGDIVVWDNPIVGRFVTSYINWMVDHYSSAMEYDYDTRGNPELDVGDVIFQDDSYDDDMSVLVTEYRLDFRQAFSGRAVTYKLGGSS